MIAVTVAAVVALGSPDAVRHHELAGLVSEYLDEPDYDKFHLTLAKMAVLPPGERKAVLRLLTRHLTSTTRVGLRNSADTIIPYRTYTTRELYDFGHGGLVYQDLFIVGGKAAYAVGEIVQVKVPELGKWQTPAERAEAARAVTRLVGWYQKLGPGK
jgi:hypothetical protein